VGRTSHLVVALRFLFVVFPQDAITVLDMELNQNSSKQKKHRQLEEKNSPQHCFNQI
jgi:hypothetical protein